MSGRAFARRALSFLLCALSGERGGTGEPERIGFLLMLSALERRATSDLNLSKEQAQRRIQLDGYTIEWYVPYHYAHAPPHARDNGQRA